MTGSSPSKKRIHSVRRKAGEKTGIRGQGNCTNMVERRRGASLRPYGTRNRHLDAVPGLRYAPPWAIFLSSLREDRSWLSVSASNGTSFRNRMRSCDCPGMRDQGTEKRDKGSRYSSPKPG